jgi:hypothetical protein
MRKIIGLLFAGFAVFMPSFAQGDYHLNSGLRFKKYAGFYWTNGVSVNASSSKISNHSVQLGFSFGSSLMGSAMTANALSTYETELSVAKFYRTNKMVQPFLKLNFGAAFVSYGEDAELFSGLPTAMKLCSFEPGVSIEIPKSNNHLMLQISGGYNLFYGDGYTGLGTVYPIYGLIGMNYRFK